MSDFIKQISELGKNSELATTIVSGFAWFILVFFVFYFLYKLLMPLQKCSSIEDKYKSSPAIIPAVKSKYKDMKLINFYIKTAYNCCSLGNYSNDSVGTCILTSVLKQGVRCLDFEIFSLNDMPVVATSTTNSYYTKETYNSIPFSEILAQIATEAFTLEIAPNSVDPLFIHLRIKSNNPIMFGNLNKMLTSSGPTSKLYSGEIDPTTITLNDMVGKIIVIVNNENKSYIGTGMYNMVSGTSAFKTYKYSQIQNLTKQETMDIQNTNQMSILMPSDGTSPDNIDLNKAVQLKCNMIAMRYQELEDPLLANYNKMFEKSAFILKSELFLDTA